MTQSRNRNPDARATAPLELVYTDLPDLLIQSLERVSDIQ